MEVNVDMLEQMDLMDMSDHEALDVFLHSGGEDNSAASPVAGTTRELHYSCARKRLHITTTRTQTALTSQHLFTSVTSH